MSLVGDRGEILVAVPGELWEAPVDEQLCPSVVLENPSGAIPGIWGPFLHQTPAASVGSCLAPSSTP